MSLTFEGDGTISGFDAGLSGFGGLVAVKHVIFTGTQTASVAAGGNVAVTDVSITHEVADANNKLIISALIGALGSSSGFGDVSLAVHDGSGLIAVGDAAGSRTRVTTGGNTAGTNTVAVVGTLSATFVHTPGSGSKTYTLRAVSSSDATRTLYINRSEIDNSTASRPRAVSSLVIQEVSV